MEPLKKLFVLLAVFCMLLFLAACGGNGGAAAPTPEPEAETETAYEPEEDEEEENGEPEAEPEDEEEAAPGIELDFAELDRPEFTHTTENLGFVTPENWDVTDQGGGSVFLVVDGNQLVINLLGAHTLNPDWDNPLAMMQTVFLMMLSDVFEGEDVEIEEISHGEIGHAIFRATYTISFGGATHPGIGFLVSDGERFALTNGVLVAELEELTESYYDFIASIRFLE